MSWPRPAVIIASSVIIALLTIGPLLLRIAYGPKDENPVGLGLLAFFGMLVGGGGIVLGVVRWFVERG